MKPALTSYRYHFKLGEIPLLGIAALGYFGAAVFRGARQNGRWGDGSVGRCSRSGGLGESLLLGRDHGRGRPFAMTSTGTVGALQFATDK